MIIEAYSRESLLNQLARLLYDVESSDAVYYLLCLRLVTLSWAVIYKPCRILSPAFKPRGKLLTLFWLPDALLAVSRN